MTQDDMRVNKTEEFNALFLKLNDKGQDAALTVLRSLEFAQSVMSNESEGGWDNAEDM